MKRLLVCLSTLSGALLFAGEPEVKEPLSEQTFEVLVTDDESKIIEELVTVMGERSLWYLFANQSYVGDLGKKTRPISSTQFLGYVFAHEELVACMKDISKSSLKWKRFSKGIKRGLAKEAEDGSLYNSLSAFAKHTGANEIKLLALAKNEDWNGFLLQLLN